MVKMALETPERFVLKPQREGGGKCVCVWGGGHVMVTSP